MANYVMVGGFADLALTASASLDMRTAYLQLTLEGDVRASAWIELDELPAIIVLDGVGGPAYDTTWDAGAATLALVAEAQIWDGFGLAEAVLALTAEGTLSANVTWDTGAADLTLITEATVRHDALLPGTADLTLTAEATWAYRYVLPAGEATLTLTADPVVWHVSAVVTGTAMLFLSLDGDLIGTTAEGVDADTEARTLGYRPGMSRLVYHLGVRVIEEASVVPVGGAFLVSAAFVSVSGDPMSESGAGPGYVGFKKGTEQQPIFAFRPAYDNETVWYVGDNTLYRWSRSRDSAAWAWRPYVSLPERFIAGVQAFDLFDPDGVYAYTARILGSIAAQLQRDNDVIAHLRDPSRVPEDLIPEAAKSLDAVVEATSDYTKQRAALSLIVPIAKSRGLSEAVDKRLRSFGYRGWVAEVWRRIDWSALEVSGVTSVESSDTASIVAVSAPNGAFVVYCWRDLAPGVNISSTLAQQVQLREEAQAVAAAMAGAYPGPADQLNAAVVIMQAVEASLSANNLSAAYVGMGDAVDQMTLVSQSTESTIPADTGIPERVDYLLAQQTQLYNATEARANLDITVTSPSLKRVFRISPLSLPAGYVAISGGGTTAASVVASLVTAINAAFGVGHARLVDDSWLLFIEYPHGYQVTEPGAYWVSNQINIHVNHANGSPAILTAKQRRALATDLLTTVLPVHARIRNFATDAEAGTDGVEVGEAFEVVTL